MNSIGPSSTKEDIRKYLIWKSNTEGIYIKAHWVLEEDDTVFFMWETLTGTTVLAKYKLDEIKGYSKVE